MPHPTPRPSSPSPHGAAACAAHDTCSVPFDVVKQRLQEGAVSRGSSGCRSGGCRGASEVAAWMWRREGAAAFYRSLPTTIAMN
eukprot:gene49905-35433_t